MILEDDNKLDNWQERYIQLSKEFQQVCKDREYFRENLVSERLTNDQMKSHFEFLLRTVAEEAWNTVSDVNMPIDLTFDKWWGKRTLTVGDV